MMPVIEVDQISKMYTIGHQRAPYASLREEIAGLIRKPLLFLRTHKRETEYFWALKEISFTVHQGEVLGIIGKNGSGKSTLLKILSRVTLPTSGRAKLRGKVASLLEIGTGFSPELTGRENIFLNGSILGMSKRDISRKLDDIVGFAEIEKFLDTPVKFYSSGMYVRLAFAVAAHLDSDILIVDEVLAVGDAEFQRKCLGKMKKESQERGRTVLLVSHNMGAVGALCARGIVLDSGAIIFEGEVGHAISQYLRFGTQGSGKVILGDGPADSQLVVRSIGVVSERTGSYVNCLEFQEPFSIEIVVEARRDLEAIVGVGINNDQGITVTTAHTQEIGEPESERIRLLRSIVKGSNAFRLQYPTNCLRPGRYYVSCSVFSRRLNKNYAVAEQALSFEIASSNDRFYFDERQAGIFFPIDCVWERS